ncbi:MAG TPA: hypothetical protein VFB72_16570, partial [Verrucomicrobiae bacterium]|nr:hypothetical protein [Verrucomicrobiae bacterium]
PQAVIDKRGTIHLIYYKGEAEAGDIFYVRQPAGQTGFTSPIPVNTQPGSAMAIGSIRGAQLALGRNDRVHVAWNGHAPKGRSYLEAPMLYTRMNDSGTAFEPERNIITTARGLDGGGSVAADDRGDVYVMWHAPKPGQKAEEDEAAVFVAKSVDDGKTFGPEKLAITNATGACGCCGMKAFADTNGNVLAFYRAARNLTQRNETLLLSNDRGATFEIVFSHDCRMAACPMSSSFLSWTPNGILAAAESQGMIYCFRVDPATGLHVPPGLRLQAQGKYPVAVGNARGRVLVTWIEGSSWGKGGTVAWQVFNQGDGYPVSNRAKAGAVPAWSFATAVTRPDGSFTIIF